MDESVEWEDHLIILMLLLRKQIVVFRCFVLLDHIYPLQTLYTSLLECDFRYGDIVWVNCGEDSHEKIRNRAARIMHGSHKS